MDVDLATLPSCKRCQLSQTRTRVVVGSGDTNARVMCIGEAPGRNEDEGGAPFIGAAGRVLDEFLQRAQLTRDEIYVTNVVKCRPPQNRNPYDDEVRACKPWLDAQIDATAPDVIVIFGAVAARALLGADLLMSELAGTLGTYQYNQGSDAQRLATVLVVYHPAATIYNRSLRDTFFASADLLRALLAEQKGERHE